MRAARPTTTTEGRCSALVSCSGGDLSSSRDSTMMMKDTEVIRKQKTMLPAVSMRALPEGKRRGSTRLTARLQTMRVTLDMGSKMASAMVVNKERDPPEDTAA